MTAAPTQRGVSIASGDGHVFGLFHPVDPAATPGTAVLICPPFGWEDMCSYRSRLAWAQSLAGAGRPTLRIDLPSTGESPGSPREPGRLEAWTAAVVDSAAWLRATTGAGRVAAIGIGLGGLVAGHAVGRGAPIDDLVLWAVPGRGRRLLRELRAFASLNSEVDIDDVPLRTDLPLPPPEPDGSLAVGGFLLSAETVAALEALDLSDDPFPDAESRRVLMLERDGIEVDGQLRARLEQAGAAVAVAPGPGYGPMMAHPQEARPPLAEFALVAEWLTEAETAANPVADAPVIGDSIELTHAGARIRETPIAIEQPFGHVYGVLAECAEAPASGMTAVLVNAGALRRIGPGRLWVELARDWAARGIPTLRIDLEGIGDADGDGTPYADTAELYVPKLVDQTIAALDRLEARGLAARFVVAGLCSGAYWCFHAALRDPRVEAAFLLNPRALFYDRSLDVVREANKVRELRSPVAWRRVLRGEIPLARAGKIARTAVTAPLRARADSVARRTRRRDLDAALVQLDRSRKRILFLFGGNEPLHDEMVADGQAAVIERAPEMQLEVIPGRDHSFRPISAQRHVRAVLERAIDSELALARTPLDTTARGSQE